MVSGLPGVRTISIRIYQNLRFQFSLVFKCRYHISPCYSPACLWSSRTVARATYQSRWTQLSRTRVETCWMDDYSAAHERSGDRHQQPNITEKSGGMHCSAMTVMAHTSVVFVTLRRHFTKTTDENTCTLHFRVHNIHRMSWSFIEMNSRSLFVGG